MRTAVSVTTMRESDRLTIEGGTPGLELMQRAGKAIYREVNWHGNIAILCGSGNNGGDGYVLASLLKKNGFDPTLIRIDNRFSPDGKACFDMAKTQGVSDHVYVAGESLKQYDIIVDCLLGTGFSGCPEGIMADAIRAINTSGSYVVSVDINSGLNGDSGQTELCVSSDLTVSVGTLKTGLLLGVSRDKIKRLVNVDIGIPIAGKSYYVLDVADVSNALPKRLHASHKGTYGYVTILGGCMNYSGAVKLANLSCAAMRAGAGVCRLAVPADIANAVAPHLLESTLELIPSETGVMQYVPEILDRILATSAAVSIGMGWGNGDDHMRILNHILTRSEKPLLLDADGLNTLARVGADLLLQAKCPIILTPHLREFSRISGITEREILSDPIGHAEDFARKYKTVLLLKGATTVITDGENTYLSERGCPGMATAGSGDVLSGVITGLLGYLPASALTAAVGAFVAGLAGELAEADVNPISMCASDTVKYLPMAIKEIMK